MPSIYVVYVQKKLILSRHVKSLLCLILHELKKKVLNINFSPVPSDPRFPSLSSSQILPPSPPIRLHTFVFLFLTLSYPILQCGRISCLSFPQTSPLFPATSGSWLQATALSAAAPNIHWPELSFSDAPGASDVLSPLLGPFWGYWPAFIPSSSRSSSS